MRLRPLKNIAMNKFIISSLAIASLALMGCEDDRDDNPTLKVSNGDIAFVLNEPSYKDFTVDLASSTSLDLTWSQPEYGFPVASNYYVQISKDGNFAASTDEASNDTTGTLVADYYQLDAVTGCQTSVSGSDFATALENIYLWDSEEEVPASVDAYVRILSQPVANDAKYNIASNAIKLTVAPYYISLTPAETEIWYLIGACIGDGAWTNDASAIGTSIYPMEEIEGAKYDTKTGQGEITFTGYFATTGFKLVKTPGSWDDQWGQGDSFGSFLKNDGGSSNITVPSDGYYTVTLNTATDELTVVAADITPTVFESMCMSGDFNEWGDTAMNPVNTTVANNHLWQFTFDATSSDTKVKFKMADSWESNWGGTSLEGWGVNGGADIPVPAGKYNVIFNDISGYYKFIQIIEE